METPTTDLPTIPGYRLLEKLGEGGMGEVFRALQLSLQRVVAIKLLHQSSFLHTAWEDFQREACLMAALSHPHVVIIHDFGRIDGRAYLVMEHVRGPSLRQMLQPGTPWPSAAALSLLESIALALGYIHSRGILHLDLKPENVLFQVPDSRPIDDSLADAGQEAALGLEDLERAATSVSSAWKCSPKITDFGLARLHRDMSGTRDLSLVQGTVDYCALELRHGLPVDHRTDLFALATMAYEILTGRLPGRVYVPAALRNPRLPPAVDEVLSQGLERDRDLRLASVDEFRRRLRRSLQPGTGKR